MTTSRHVVLAATGGASAGVLDRMAQRAAHGLALLGVSDVSRTRVDAAIILADTTTPVLDNGLETVVRRRSVVTSQNSELSSSITLRSAGLTVEADWLGLSHLYWGMSEGVFVISDNSLAAAATIGASLDSESVGVLALLGFLIDDRTLFSGVRRLRADERIDLDYATGRVRDHSPTRNTPTRDGHPAASLSELVHEGAAGLSSLVEGLVELHPDALLELSGGLDSRGVLAAIPKRARKRVHGYTLGRAGDPDVIAARDVAEAAGVRWTQVDRSVLGQRDPDSLMAQAELATSQRSASTNAIAALLLDEGERMIPAGPRFTGANGEYARGFYYPGVLTDGAVTRRRVEKLARWRLFTNDGTAAQILVPSVVAAARSAVLASVQRTMVHDGGWRANTDELYLEMRMASWAGAGYSARAADSVPLAPYFDRTFIRWARSLPHRAATRERAFAGVVREMDAPLARLALDRGPTVIELASDGLGRVSRQSVSTAKRAAKKAEQRLRGTPKGATRQALLADQMRSGWNDGQTGRLAASGFFSDEAIERLGAGSSVDSNSLSLAINVSTALRFVERVADTRDRKDRATS